MWNLAWGPRLECMVPIEPCTSSLLVTNCLSPAPQPQPFPREVQGRVGSLLTVALGFSLLHFSCGIASFSTACVDFILGLPAVFRRCQLIPVDAFV